MSKFSFSQGPPYIIKEQANNQRRLKYLGQCEQAEPAICLLEHLVPCGQRMPLVVREISLKYLHPFIFTLNVHQLTFCCRHFPQGILALRCCQLVPGKSPATTESCAAADRAPIVRYEEEPITQTPKSSGTNSRKRKKRFHNQTIREQVRKTWRLQVPGYGCQVPETPQAAFLSRWEYLGEARETQCAGPFPSRMLLAL